MSEKKVVITDINILLKQKSKKGLKFLLFPLILGNTNNLTGSIPSEIWNLTGLTVFE